MQQPEIVKRRVSRHAHIAEGRDETTLADVAAFLDQSFNREYRTGFGIRTTSAGIPIVYGGIRDGAAIVAMYRDHAGVCYASGDHERALDRVLSLFPNGAFSHNWRSAAIGVVGSCPAHVIEALKVVEKRRVPKGRVFVDSLPDWDGNLATLDDLKVQAPGGTKRLYVIPREGLAFVKEGDTYSELISS